MRIIHSACLPIIISAFLSGNAYAAEGAGDLDVTIRVIDSKQGINEFINRIELPRGIAEHAPVQPQEAAGSSNTSRQADDDAERNRSDSKKNREDRRNSDDHERNGDERSKQNIEPDASDRSWTSDNKRKEAADHRNGEHDSRENRENMRSHTREQQASDQEKPRND
jgi:hypothetical protein